MNSFSTQYLSENTKATSSYGNVQSHLSQSQEQQQSISSSSMSLILPNPVAREARLRLDSKKSLIDDHIFYPYRLEQNGWTDNMYSLAFSFAGPQVQDLAKYNDDATQRSFKNSLERNKQRAGISSPAPLDSHNFHLHNMVNRESKGNPYLVNFNSQYPMFSKDDQHYFSAKSGRDFKK